jgi:hypothetical protein
MRLLKIRTFFSVFAHTRVKRIEYRTADARKGRARTNHNYHSYLASSSNPPRGVV